MNEGGRAQRLFLLAGIGLISLAGMALEIILTRVFSVLFFYHYVFAILSIAVMGLGLGAALVYRWAPGLSPREALSRAQLFALLAAAAVLGLAWLVLATVAIDGRILLASASAVPYVLLGMALATLFSAQPTASPTLYGADLLGAGLGAIAAIWLLNWLGGPGALLLTGLLFSAGSLCLGLATGQGVGRLRVAATATVAFLIGGGLVWGDFDVDMSRLATPKPLTQQLQNAPEARIVYSQWDAFARTDVLESSAQPWQKQVFINGAAGSSLPRLPNSIEEERRFREDIGYFPFSFSTPERVFVLGPGGGKDVLFALLAGARHIVAVEVSPGVVAAVRHFSQYSGGLFEHPFVTITIDEGRSYLRRSQEQFDSISLSEVIALTAERGSYILAENYVYTTEAFQDYLDHLAPGGRLVLKLYDEYTLTRAFTTAIAALRERGLDDVEATRRMVVLLDPRLVSQQAPFRSPLLILHRDPLTPESARSLLATIEEAGFIPLFVPHVLERPPLAGLTSGQTTLEDLVTNFERADVSPTTDNQPFFYEFRTGLPDLLRQLLVALAVVAALGTGYLWWLRRRAEGPFWLPVLYFGLLGIGFMLVELALIQQLTLFLGHPTTALAVGLSAALVSSGLGSLVGGQVNREEPQRTIVLAALMGGLLALIYTPLGPILFRSLLGLAQPLRIALALAFVFPIFFVLGMPFPLGLRVVGRRTGYPLVPLAWATNGFASVVGSVGAISLAILWGFDVVLAGGGVIYLATALLARKVNL